MKIFLALNHFLPTHIAGIEIYCFNLARSLKIAGAEVSVIIPHFDMPENDSYQYEGINVIRFSENSIEDRAMMQGKTKPAGLLNYANLLESERPDIVHFQELAQGRGIGIYHVEATASLGIPVYLTCHLSTYSCQTGHLFYKDQIPCDGIIRIGRCSSCTYHVQVNSGVVGKVLAKAAGFFEKIGVDTTKSNSALGTAFGFPFIIEKKKRDLLKIAGLCKNIVVLSKWYKSILEANGIPTYKMVYIAQGLAGETEEPADEQTTLPLKLVFIGRISRYKGVHLLLQAFKDLPSNKIQLDIYGQVRDDEYAMEWKQFSSSMTNVNWEGEIPQENVTAMLTGYDLLCLPSTFSEMSPMVIQEAFAAGLPVLASNVYGNAEQVKDNVNGWLFEFNNVADLKKSLTMLIDDPALIDAAKKNIPGTRGFDKVATEHLEMYQIDLMI
jgi:glycosyltransferase involved in cell wall biosynthesis